jgi:hypothetical protein
MKTVLAMIFVLSAMTAYAGEVESNCAQINDSVDRDVRDNSTRTQSTGGLGSANGQ